MEIYYQNLIKTLSLNENLLVFTNCKKFLFANVKTIFINKRILNIPGTAKFGVLINLIIKLFLYRNKIKLIHFSYTSNAGKYGYVLPLVKKFFGIRYIMQLHGGGMGKWKFLSGNKTLFENADKLIAVSDIIKNEYEKRINKEIELIFPLVEFKRSNRLKENIMKGLSLHGDEKILLFSGSLKRIKGPDVLLDAFMSLGIEYVTLNKLFLIFAGEGDMREKLGKKTVNSEYAKHIKFLGLVPYELMPDYYKIADIYVIASHFEGTPKSLLEAMFNELPIIGSDVEGINNIIINNNNGLLFKKNNVMDLAEKIKLLLHSKETLKNISSNTYDTFCKKYSYSTMINNLIRIYRNF